MSHKYRPNPSQAKLVPPEPPKIIRVNLTDLENIFDVRKQLNPDNLARLRALRLAGVKLDPITIIVNPTKRTPYGIHDGRHRVAIAGEFQDLEIDCILLDETDPVVQIALALQANEGRVMPSDRASYIHSFKLMFEKGATDASIRLNCHFLPPNLIRDFISTARGVIQKERIAKAMQLIADGARISEAAQGVGLDEETISDAFNGKRGKWGANDTVREIGKINRYITTELSSANTGISQHVINLFKRLEDFEVRPDDVAKVLAKWETHLAGTVHRIKDWKQRLQTFRDKHQ